MVTLPQVRPLILGLLLMAGASDSVGAVRVSAVLCSERVDPVGVDPDRVTFSWRMESSGRGESQSAYQVRIATEPERLAAGEPDLWDSGKIKSSQSLLVPYSHSRLAAGRAYFWRVRVWDKSDIPSEWSPVGRFVTALRTPADWRGAKWIGFEELPPGAKLIPGIHISDPRARTLHSAHPVVPLFRKAFEINKPVKDAVVFVSGLGQYEFLVNGTKVGDRFLTPGWTDYAKTCLYNTYDVAALLKAGTNALGAIVGNGFHNVNAERYWKLSIAYGNPKITCLLRIRYRDGSEETVSSDPGWKTAPSPITFSSIYGGEDYDARLEQKNWANPGFDDSGWKNAVAVDPPGGRLLPEEDYPLKVHETFTPVSVTDPVPGVRMYDFGQNCSGIVSLTVQGRKGQTLRLTPAELVDARSLANQKASGRPYYWTYTLGSDQPENWTPRFTYYGFRYVQVELASPADDGAETPKVLGLELLHTRNSAPPRGHFECSSELFNRIGRLIDWAVRSNLASVMTDCPHREKLGWLEQTHLMGEAVHFGYDLHHLYRKQLRDMIDAQTSDGLVPDIAPEYVQFERGFRDSPEWGSAAVILPMFLYRWYGDLEPVKTAYPMMQKYAAYLGSLASGDILSHGLGDWYDLGPRFPGEAQLTPKAVTATAIYYQDLKLLEEYAGLLGLRTDAARYARLSSRVREAFNRAFFDSETGTYSTGSQTAISMPLCLGLVGEKDRARVFESLLRTVERGGRALTAGDIGFHYLVKALSDGGASELLFAMNSRDDVPGYGFQLAKKATALTESWAALEEVSNNHLMLGHLMEWFYTGLAGIGQARDSAAYANVVLNPQMIPQLQWFDAAFESPYGRFRSSWKREAGSRTLDVEVPVNAKAEVRLPAGTDMKVLEGGRDIASLPDIQVKSRSATTCILTIGSGTYHFEFTGTDLSK